MGFLDNSGDIILDAVLTDLGRKRLAKGDGSFRIAKYCLFDDEINYANYNKNDPSGSAFFDVQILTTPVQEAFTDNAASAKSKLITIPRTNLLYLPVIKLNEVFWATQERHSLGTYIVAVDKDTEEALATVNGQMVRGILFGETAEAGSSLRIDQGLDTVEITPAVSIDPDLVETQYIVEMDNRLGKISQLFGARGTVAKVSYIDDDNKASYFFSLGTDPNYVKENTEKATKTTQTIRGPRGTTLQFGIKASLELNTSTYLFSQLGSTTTMDPNSTAILYIDTIIRVTGATTGASVDIPVRFVKKQ